MMDCFGMIDQTLVFVQEVNNDFYSRNKFSGNKVLVLSSSVQGKEKLDIFVFQLTGSHRTIMVPNKPYKQTVSEI